LILGGPQEADVGGYRGHASATAHYGSQYGAAYGSTAMSGAQQVCFSLLIFMVISKLFMFIYESFYIIEGNL
jgi:hypothetical protein